jgi:DNA-binding transcriptional regulator YdaS (Cro superfamily)
MTLASYMIESGLTDGELAAKLGVSGELVRLWRHGQRDISAKRAVAISKMTKIPLHELRPDLWPAPKRARRTPESTPPPVTESAA